MKFFTFIVLVSGILSLNLMLGQTNNYTNEQGYDYLYYAKVSYCEEDQIQDWTCAACEYHKGVTDVTVITNKLFGAQLYLGYDPENELIVIAFRGSENIQNWFANLDAKKQSYPYCSGCQVHTGFYKFWNSVSDETINTLDNLQRKYSSAELLVTGHSLGGAAAVLCTLDLQQSGYKVNHFYSFGCPRVGNSEFAAYFDNTIPNAKTVIHYKDPVPHVPTLEMGFIRVNTEVWYSSKSKYDRWQWCPSAPGYENNFCSDQFLAYTSIEEHLHYLGIYTGCTLEQPTSEAIQLMLDSQIQVIDQLGYRDDLQFE